MDEPLIDRETSERLQRDGANARALGQSFLDSPFYRPENMPRATGEPTAVWAAREAAWRLGWDMEDRMRPSALDAILRRIEPKEAGEP